MEAPWSIVMRSGGENGREGERERKRKKDVVADVDVYVDVEVSTSVSNHTKSPWFEWGEWTVYIVRGSDNSFKVSRLKIEPMPKFKAVN